MYPCLDVVVKLEVSGYLFQIFNRLRYVVVVVAADSEGYILLMNEKLIFYPLIKKYSYPL